MSTPRPERAVVLERIEQALRQRLASTPGSAASTPGSAAFTPGSAAFTPGSEDSTRGYIPGEDGVEAGQARERGFGNVAPGGVFGTRGGGTRGGGTRGELDGSLARAEQRSREAEALIDEVAAALAGWRERAMQLRQRLAEWPSRAL